MGPVLFSTFGSASSATRGVIRRCVRVLGRVGVNRGVRGTFRQMGGGVSSLGGGGSGLLRLLVRSGVSGQDFNRVAHRVSARLTSYRGRLSRLARGRSSHNRCEGRVSAVHHILGGTRGSTRGKVVNRSFVGGCVSGVCIATASSGATDLRVGVFANRIFRKVLAHLGTHDGTI